MTTYLNLMAVTQAVLPPYGQEPANRERLPKQPNHRQPSDQDLDNLFAQPPAPMPYGANANGSANGANGQPLFLGKQKAVWKSASSSRNRPRTKAAVKMESFPLDRETRTAKPNRIWNCSSRLAAFCLATY